MENKDMCEVTGATPERFGNTAAIAAAAFRDAGLDPADWKPGDLYPERYIVYTVSGTEKCPYCELLKNELKPLMEQGKISVEFVPLSRDDRQRLYDSLELTERREVPQVALYDRRSGRPQHIGNRQDFAKWMSIMMDEKFAPPAI